MEEEKTYLEKHVRNNNGAAERKKMYITERRKSGKPGDLGRNRDSLLQKKRDEADTDAT